MKLLYKYVMEHTLQEIAIRIFKNKLYEKGLNQNDFAEMLSTTRQTVSGYLTNKTEFTLKKFEEFCFALDISVAHVMEAYIKEITGDDDTEFYYGKNLDSAELIKQLKGRLKDKDEIINMLRQQLEECNKS